MGNKQLLEKLRSLGYPLLEVQEPLEVNTALADVVKSKNARFLEGFPVMLANAAKQEGFNYAKLRSLLVKHEARDVLERLFLLSLAMYKANDLYFDWVKEYEAKFTTKDKASLNTLMSSLNSSPEVKVGAYRLNVERLNNAFHHYLAGESKEVKDLSAKHEGMSLEFSLSQVFSPKQKELFKKKLKGEVLTKTEREYFSRSVRKKVSALANEQLHRLAQKVNG
jgi:hypothetical protein